MALAPTEAGIIWKVPRNAANKDKCDVAAIKPGKDLICGIRTQNRRKLCVKAEHGIRFVSNEPFWVYFAPSTALRQPSMADGPGRHIFDLDIDDSVPHNAKFKYTLVRQNQDCTPRLNFRDPHIRVDRKRAVGPR